MTKATCHGCQGKGWILIVTAERVVPFLNQVDRKPVEGLAIQTREFGVEICPICKGTGSAAGEPAREMAGGREA